MRTLLRAINRTARLGWHLTRGLVKALALRQRFKEDWHQSHEGKQEIQQWMKSLCQILGLQVAAKYRAANAPVMLVANHISWLDIIAIGSLIPSRFLAKDDVRRWPFIGTLTNISGTLFIQRYSHKAAYETTQCLTRALADGQSIVIFPEGTTTDGHAVSTFKPALFEASRRAHCAIQPVAIRYWRSDALDTIAPYIADDNFMMHLWRVMATPQTQVDLHFCPPIESNAPRRTLATFCHMIISTELKNNYPSATGTQETCEAAMLEQAA